MPRPRMIRPDEADVWLSVLLDAAFDPAQGEAVAAKRLDLLAVAHDITHYPDDIPIERRAALLVCWVERWLSAKDWMRLQGRVRKRRSR